MTRAPLTFDKLDPEVIARMSEMTPAQQAAVLTYLAGTTTPAQLIFCRDYDETPIPQRTAFLLTL